MACLVYWYISGTFGHTAFVSFGDSTLNSRSRRHVMYWSAGPNQIYNETFLDFQQHIRVNDVTASLYNCFF